jgi:hypothetical protein
MDRRDALRALHALPHRWRRLQRLHQERRGVAATLPEVIGRAHRADAHHVVGQRDQPEPALREAGDGDVAGVVAGAAAHATEVAEDRRRLVAPAALLDPEAGTEEGVAAAGVDDVAHAHLEAAAIGPDRLCAAGACAVEGQAGDRGLLAYVDATGSRMFDQELVETVALDVEGVVVARIERPVEAEHVDVPRGAGQREVRAVLGHPDRADLVEHAQALEDRQVHRQQRFADVETRMARLLEQQHAPAAPREQRRGGAPGRATADDEDVGVQGPRRGAGVGGVGRHRGCRHSRWLGAHAIIRAANDSAAPVRVAPAPAPKIPSRTMEARNACPRRPRPNANSQNCSSRA